MAIEKSASGSVTFTDEHVDVFRALAIKHALRLWVRAGIRVNRAYTPTAMVAAASEYTGKRYKRGKDGAAAALADLEAVLAAYQQQRAQG